MLVIISGLYILAATILCISNSGDNCDIHVFTKPLKGQSLGTILIIAAIAGAIGWQMLKICWANSWSIYKDRKSRNKIRTEIQKVQKSQTPTADENKNE